MPTPSTAPRPNASRQPTSAAKMLSLSRTRESSAPAAVPSQNDPLMIRSTVPRTRAGISSSMETGARDVDGRGAADLALRQLDAGAVLGEATRDRADDGDLEAVEDPHRAQADDDEPMPPGPWQPVHLDGP